MAEKLNKVIKGKMTKKFSRSASPSTGRVHVVPSKSGWSVKREGVKRSSVVKNTRGGAVTAAKNLKSTERIIVHRKDGTIQKNTIKRK